MASPPLSEPAPASATGWPAVLELLADGSWHSGVSLGNALGLTRAAIWKQVRALRSLGVMVSAERSRGYRLDQSLELLSAAAIRDGLTPETQRALDRLEVLTVTVSTNDWLTARPVPPVGQLWACVAEYQTGGRGRRGRRWLSPLGQGVCLSVSWAFEVAPRDIASLSLVAGVAVAGCLTDAGVAGVGLKWPNDIMAGGRKVGGILVEVAGEPGGPLRAVIGVGLNVRRVPGVAAALRDEAAYVPVGLDELLREGCLERNALVASLLNALHASLRNFGRAGATFQEAWQRYDCLAGWPVVVTSGKDVLRGIARGIAGDGALLVEVEGRVIPVIAGDVTLRTPA